MQLTQRKQKILSAVAENYLMTGEPVGSKFLQTETDLNVSSATIRNELADLSAMGYLEQPHTSAGRIPSQKGLRYYINYLMIFPSYISLPDITYSSNTLIYPFVIFLWLPSSFVSVP